MALSAGNLNKIMINGVEIPFADDDIFVFKGMILTDAFSTEGLVLDFQQVLNPFVFKHRGGRPKVKMLVGVLYLHVDNGSIVL